MTDEQLQRQILVDVWVLNRIEMLRADGIISGGSFRISEEGLKVAQRLKTQGFRPTADEIIISTLGLQSMNRL
jgi:hypothetical protein